MYNNIDIIQVDLDDKIIRNKLSNELKDMEKEFSYPLGESFFFIKHGFNSKEYDYFSYFEQLGTPYFFALRKENKTIGSICFILRIVSGQKFWYICDLKIIKEEQSKKITFMLYNLLRNRLSSITKSYCFINMCPLKNNGLFKIANQVLKGFDMDIMPLYIYEVDKNSSLIQDKILGHNRNKKDIVINGKPIPLYHVIDNIENRVSNIQKENNQYIEEDATVMFCSYEEIVGLNPSSVGVFCKSGMEKLENLSTFEI